MNKNFSLCLSAFVRKTWILLQTLREIDKKIDTEHSADFHQQRCVYVVTFENIVDIPAVATDLAAKPCHGLVLSPQFRLDETSYVFTVVLLPAVAVLLLHSIFQSV